MAAHQTVAPNMILKGFHRNPPKIWSNKKSEKGLLSDKLYNIAMENPPCLIGDTSSNGGFPIAMLDYRSVVPPIAMTLIRSAG